MFCYVYSWKKIWPNELSNNISFSEYHSLKTTATAKSVFPGDYRNYLLIQVPVHFRGNEGKKDWHKYQETMP